MKIQAVTNNTNTPVTNRPAHNNHKQNVSFGFSEDYGDDSFLYDSDHNNDGNILEYIGLIIEFPISLIQEMIEQKREARKSQQANEADS